MRRILVCSVVLLAMVSAGCSSGDGDSSMTASSTTVVDTAFAAGTAGQGAPAAVTFDRARSLVGDDPLVVNTVSGPVHGATSDGVRAFQAIPYAAPPVADRRFKAPRPVEKWTAPRQATTRSPSCMQTLPIVNLTTGQEDCLYLNVVAPVVPAKELAPVMVWIHGGGFTVGSVNDDPPAHIVERAGVVVVSINYRLGPFGFLADASLAKEDPNHAVGTMGILDQVAALEWVRDSIAAFGGDPHNVTLFGESAGGMSVCAHLYSPRSAGLFQRAVMQSGPCERAGIPKDAALAQGAELAHTLHCDTTPEVLACLRRVDATTLFTAMPGDPTFLFRKAAFWLPTADDVVVPSDPGAARASGRFSHVPVLAGVTRDEGRLFFGMAAHTQNAQVPPMTASDYPSRVASYFGAALGPKVVEQYPLAKYPDSGAAFGQAVGDATLACPAVDGALALAGAVPVYLYQYEHAPNPFVLPVKGIDMGAFHSAELPYVFGVPVSSSGAIELTPPERALSDSMIDAWTRFARTGDPSDPSFAWPLAGATRSYRVFDLTGRVAEQLRTDICGFWKRSGFDPTKAGRQ